MADPDFEIPPFRLAVLQRLTDALKEIAPSNGYTFALGVADDAPYGRVFRGRAAYGDNDPLPMVSIIEDPRNLAQDVAPPGSPATIGDWCLLIQGFVEDDLVHPTDPAYFLLANVKRRIAELRSHKRDILGFGSKAPCINDIKLGSGVVRPPDEISAKTYFWLPVTLSLAEDHSNPFTST